MMVVGQAFILIFKQTMGLRSESVACGGTEALLKIGRTRA
jgi:hypothetical protein